LRIDRRHDNAAECTIRLVEPARHRNDPAVGKTVADRSADMQRVLVMGALENEAFAVDEVDGLLGGERIDDQRAFAVNDGKTDELGGMSDLLEEPGFQLLAHLEIDRLMREPLNYADQDRIRCAKGQLGVLDERLGDVGRVHSAVCQRLRTLIDDAKAFQSDQNGAGSRNKSDDAPGREDMGRAALEFPVRDRFLRLRHDGGDPLN